MRLPTGDLSTSGSSLCVGRTGRENNDLLLLSSKDLNFRLSLRARKAWLTRSFWRMLSSFRSLKRQTIQCVKLIMRLEIALKCTETDSSRNSSANFARKPSFHQISTAKTLCTPSSPKAMLFRMLSARVTTFSPILLNFLRF